MPLKEDCYYLHFPREGNMPHQKGPHGEASIFGQQAEAVRGKQGPEPLLFPTGDTRRGRGNGLGLASLNDVGRLWTREVVFSCVLPGPR